MVSSLQSIVLYSVPIAMLFDLLKTLWHLPMRHDCLCALFKRCTHEELRDLAKTLPWDHPVARKLDHEVHRRHMPGESYGFHFFSGVGHFSLYLFFPQITHVFPGVDFLRTVLWPVHLCSEPDSIGPHVSGFQPVRINFCLIDSLDFMENQPVCHIYQWVAHPTHGGVCNHCERMMDGL